MSRLSDEDADLTIYNSRLFVELFNKKFREYLANFPKTNADLICSGVWVGVLTEGSAADLLKLNLLEFRDVYQKFIKERGL